MKFSISVSDLHGVIKLLSITARANTPLPEGRVLIKAFEKDGLVFNSHNGSTGLMIKNKNAFVEEPGETSIVFSEIRSFALSFSAWDGKSGAKEFLFNEKDGKLIVTVSNVYENGKKSTGRLKLGMHDTYGMVEVPEFVSPTLILNSAILRSAFSKILYAINKNHYLANLRNIVVKFDEQDVKFAASDGAVVSEYKVKNITNKISGDILLPYTFIMDLRRILGEGEQMLFDIREREILVKFGESVLVGSADIGHTFPDYESPFDEFSHVVSVDRDILMGNILPFIDILDSEDDNRLSIDIKGTEMILKNDSAAVNFEMISNYENEFSIDLNGIFLKQTIEAIQDDTILIKFSNEDGYFICDSANFENQRALILPLGKRA